MISEIGKGGSPPSTTENIRLEMGTAPTSLFPKKNPRREIALGKRPISDLWGVNMGFDKQDCYKVR